MTQAIFMAFQAGVQSLCWRTKIFLCFCLDVRMARALYSLVFYCLMPFVLLRLLWRARLAPAYRQRWTERLGFSPRRVGGKPAIWVHAVSVGETLAALPMMLELLQRYPDYQLIVTTTTPTGSERVQVALAKELASGRVLHCYAPYDIPCAVAPFLKRMAPQLAIIMETELWPNTIAACHKRGIPVIVANARLSARSARGYGRFSALMRPMLQQLSLVAAQHDDDASRFQALGDVQVRVTGNIKFDLTLDQALQDQAVAIRQRWQHDGERLVWLAASTHQGEDEQLLDTFEQVRKQRPNLLLVLVPRHPERFDSVTRLVKERGYQFQRHSQGGSVALGTQVLVADTMGELMALLGASDLCFMGGTLVENGGHNFIEPAAWSLPQLSGPSLFNFSEVSRLLLDAGALELINNSAELARKLEELCADKERRLAMGAAGFNVAEANRGALERLLAEIDQLLMA